MAEDLEVSGRRVKMGIENQVVLITGCSSGIGRALVGEFAASGHHVVATARNIDSIADLADTAVQTLALDVTNDGSIETAVDEACALNGRIDIVVNNAGYALIGPVAELELDDLRTQIETNLVGVVAVIRKVVPQMVARKSGRIVNIGSVSGVTATPFGGAYCGTKAAVHLVSDALRMEMAPFGIGVIEVQPGATASRFADNAAEGVGRFSGDSLFSPVADAIEARARISETNATTAEVVAKRVVAASTSARPPALVRVGNGSRRLPAIGRLPVRIRDRIFSKRFGLDRLAVG
jgi:NADP-dependent 3-hydroxy acid dehydrogenase YdfG